MRQASDMAEVYWLALTRDVPFHEYEQDPLVAAAVSDINAFTEPLKSGDGGKLTSGAIFRGETPGDLIGPYLSQFLWLEIRYGIQTLAQRYTVPARSQSFLTDYADWLACQRGVRPRARLHFDAAPRFICSARELAEYVHRDFSFQSYMNAALIMLALGKDALSPTNPYRRSRTQSGDITLGSKNVLSMLAQAALLGQKGAYLMPQKEMTFFHRTTTAAASGLGKVVVAVLREVREGREWCYARQTSPRSSRKHCGGN
jgi:hypothetical protein